MKKNTLSLLFPSKEKLIKSGLLTTSIIGMMEVDVYGGMGQKISQFEKNLKSIAFEIDATLKGVDSVDKMNRLEELIEKLSSSIGIEDVTVNSDTLTLIQKAAQRLGLISPKLQQLLLDHLNKESIRITTEANVLVESDLEYSNVGICGKARVMNLFREISNEAKKLTIETDPAYIISKIILLKKATLNAEHKHLLNIEENRLREHEGDNLMEKSHEEQNSVSTFIMNDQTMSDFLPESEVLNKTEGVMDTVISMASDAGSYIKEKASNITEHVGNAANQTANAILPESKTSNETQGAVDRVTSGTSDVGISIENKTQSSSKNQSLPQVDIVKIKK